MVKQHRISLSSAPKMYKFLKTHFELISFSFLSLFLELLVIRLVGTEIRIFAYLSNLVLLAAFIGLGFGMLIKKELPLALSGFFLFLITIITSTNFIVHWPSLDFKIFSGITELLSPLSENYIWLQVNTFSKSGVIVGFALMFFLFTALGLIFAPLGQALGKAISRGNKPIVSYSVNIAASILGLWAFQVFSLARFTPYFGIILALALMVILAKSQQRVILITLLAVTIAYISPKVESKTINYWSPYQKLSLSPAVADLSEVKPQPEGWYLEVNNVGYMSLINLTDEYRIQVKEKMDKLYGSTWPISEAFSDHYQLPYKIKENPQSVLIIGAGAGNDAAAAVRAKIPSIDAVEIDPVIIEIGNKFHYEKPSRSPNVKNIAEDGRAFLERTNKKYDLVVMGLADSHTLSSSLTNLRLDHYLYTEESLAKIKDVLTENGVLYLSFEVTRPWIGARIERGLIDVFEQKPKIFEVRSGGVYGWGGTVFVVSKNPQTLENILKNNKPLSQFIDENTKNYDSNINPLLDNWPYLYLDKPRLPLIHIISALALGSLIFIFGKKLIGRQIFDWPLFFWGAAFLLFEFQNVSKTSLLFGTTWVTNLFTITSILILLLFANWLVHKKIIKPKIAFIFLVASLILEIIFPVRLLNALTFWPKIFFGGLILNLPILFGGIIFTTLFARAKNRAGAFGANFLGAVFGGFAEMFSFLFGIHFLLFFVMGLYLAGFMFAFPPKLRR